MQMNERVALPSLLADEIGLTFLRHGSLVARTAFEPLRPIEEQPEAPRLLRASTAWIMGGREIRQAALGATGLTCGDRAFELSCALAHMRNLFFEEPDTRLIVPLPTMEDDLLAAFLEAFDDQSERGDIEPDRIVFELMAPAGPAALAKVASAMRAHGGALCLGEFGGAGSSSELIEAVAPDYVRLDAHWVRVAGGIDPSRRLLSNLVSLLRHGGRTTILAGITTEEDRETGGEIGIDLVGGLLLAPPYIAGTASPHQPAGKAPDEAAGFTDNVIPMVAGGRSHHGP